MIDLYTAATPNGWKASVTLEELGLAYEAHGLKLSNGDQKKPEFLRINPNGRIPAIVDRDAGDMALFESGAIMIYLAEKAGALLPSDPKGRAQVIQWLMFQMGGLGPMMGQANVFVRYAPEPIPFAVKRYRDESRRLLGVLNEQLRDNEYLAGDYSIADIANFCWARIHEYTTVDIEGFEHLKRWMEAIEQRSAVKAGLKVPEFLDVKTVDPEDIAKLGRKIIS